MVKISIIDDCAACGEEAGFMGAVFFDRSNCVVADRLPGEKAFDCESVADPVWSHQGFEFENCIRLTCSACGAQASIDIGGIEMTCTGKQSHSVQSWCPDALGMMVDV